MHVMTTYDENGTEITTPCDCWFGDSHLGRAVRGELVIGAATSAGDLNAMPGHQHWSAARGCECGHPCPSIAYWNAHLKSL